MHDYRNARPAMFLPGDARRTPAHLGRAAARRIRRRASDPFAPQFVTSSWRRSESGLQVWRFAPVLGRRPLLWLNEAMAQRLQRGIRRLSCAAHKALLFARRLVSSSVLADQKSHDAVRP